MRGGTFCGSWATLFEMWKLQRIEIVLWGVYSIKNLEWIWLYIICWAFLGQKILAMLDLAQNPNLGTFLMMWVWIKVAYCYIYLCFGSHFKKISTFKVEILTFLTHKIINRQSSFLEDIPVYSKKIKGLIQLLLPESYIFLTFLNHNLMVYTNYICENVSEQFTFALDDCIIIELQNYLVISSHLNQVIQRNYLCLKQNQTYI